MGKLGGLDKKAFVTHVDDVEWKEVGDGLRIKELLCEKTAGKTGFYFGVAELEAGKDIPLHRYNLAHCNYILEGEVWARLGRQRFQLEAEASNYFSIGVPHAYEASGKNGVRFLYCFATDNEIGENIKCEPVAEEVARAYYQPNCPTDLMNPSGAGGSRWAAAGDADPYIMVEAAQGSRSQFFTSTFDEGKGCKEFWWGRCITKPNCRYTPHFHEQPEIFYILSGHGTMYGGSEIFQVTPGSLFYAPKNCMHGMVNDGNDTLLALYACNLEVAGSSYNREEIADVPIVAPADRTNLMLSKV